MLSEKNKRFLLDVARKTLEEYVPKEKIPEFDMKKVDDELKNKTGIFVTLEKNGNLRGCIGNILPSDSIIKGVIHNTIASAVNDPRFPPVEKNELKSIKIKISILTPPEKLDYADSEDLLKKLTEEDGVIIKHGYASATFLPAVWEELPGKEEFLSHLCLKAGLEANAWRKLKLEVHIYHAEYFGEE